MRLNMNFEYFDEPIEIKDLTSLVLSTQPVFAQFVQALYQYEESGRLKIFDGQYKGFKKSDVMLITDILGFDVNSASVLKLIYHDLELQLSEIPEVKTEIEQHLQRVTSLVNDQLLDFEIDLEANEITFPEIFKALDIQIDVKSDSIFERLFEIIQVFKYLSKKRLLVLVNTGNYLSREEVKSLEEYVVLNQISCLMVDSRPVEGISHYFELDEDYLLFRIENDKIE